MGTSMGQRERAAPLCHARCAHSETAQPSIRHSTMQPIDLLAFLFRFVNCRYTRNISQPLVLSEVIRKMQNDVL